MKILIVKSSSLGDIIQSFPALEYLRKKFPQARIDWVVERGCAELVQAHPHINRVLLIDTKKWSKQPWQARSQLFQFYKELRKERYDLLFDLQSNLKSGTLACMARANKKIGFGFKTAREWPNPLFTSFHINPPKGRNIREDYLAIVQGFFKDFNEQESSPVSLKLNQEQQQQLETLFFEVKEKPTLVCPSSAWPNKCLSEKLLIQLLKRIEKGPYWFIWGNSREKEAVFKLSTHFPESVVLERVGLPVLQQVMARCKLVVAMDSLPLHLCGTTATPSLSFFGPSSAVKFAPLGKHHHAFQGACPYGEQFEKTCPKLRTCATASCLKLPNLSHSHKACGTDC